MNKFYAGIGARATPTEICDIMTQLAGKLEERNWWLRSGGASGADFAFQRGVKEKAQIILPWKNFNLEYQKQFPQHDYRVFDRSPEVLDSLRFHPNAANLKESVKCMMMRNYRQIRGLNEPDSSFVICWTKKGEEKGGTGQALRLANHFKITVYNLGKPDILEKMKRFLQK